MSMKVLLTGFTGQNNSAKIIELVMSSNTGNLTIAVKTCAK